MARIDRGKRALGGAIRRTKPSRTAIVLLQQNRVIGKTLDYGCGNGFDADTNGWDAFDPYYRPTAPKGLYDTIVCTFVLSALSRNNRTEVVASVRELLTENGHAYFAVARNLPITGKMGMHHSLQNYVVLTLPSVYVDHDLEIYDMAKTADFEDRTKDHHSQRDRRRDG